MSLQYNTTSGFYDGQMTQLKRITSLIEIPAYETTEETKIKYLLCKDLADKIFDSKFYEYSRGHSQMEYNYIYIEHQ